MREYKIRITGQYDILVLSPKMLSALIGKVRRSRTKELVVPAEEILPPGYAGYLTRVLQANVEIAQNLPARNVYDIIAGQIAKLQIDEERCFEKVNVSEPEDKPQFDVDTNHIFYMLTKQKDTGFRYVFRDEEGREESILLEYL